MEIQFFRQSDMCQNPFNSTSGLQLENIKWDLEPEWQHSGAGIKRGIKHEVIKFHLILSRSRDTVEQSS